MNTSLEVKSLTYHRGGKLLFSNLNFKVESGTVLTIKGPNGVGKSTLLRIIAGYIPIEKGAVFFNETNVKKDFEILSKQLCYLSHQNALKSQLTVSENLYFWQKFLNNKQNKVTEKFEVKELLTQLAGECSAGQKQRARLATFLDHNRKVWILDEPATALDTSSMKELSKLIEIHCSLGGIVILATHIDLILSCDKTLLLKFPNFSEKNNFITSDPFLDGDWNE